MFTLIEALEAIKSKPEFKHNQRNGFSVIDYNLRTTDTFKGKDASTSYILRNLRGTCFDDSGKVISLGFDAFHNLGECPGWLLHEIDFSAEHVVLEKLDGSLIRAIPIHHSGGFRLGTRAGITDISKLAEDFLANSHVAYRYTIFINRMIDSGMTPIFEFVSRKNKIVIDYPDDNLVLLAVRENSTGKYLPYSSLRMYAKHIPIVTAVANEHSSLEDLSNLVRAWPATQEGVVITFASGFHVKIKSTDYVTLHRALDGLKFEKDIIRIIMEGSLDDVLPLVDDVMKARLLAFNESVLRHYEDTLIETNRLFDLYKHLDRAEFAEAVKAFPLFQKFLFNLYLGRDPGVKAYIIRNLSSQTKVNEIRYLVGKDWNLF
jgi:T4 RnlA family RNA ligase